MERSGRFLHIKEGVNQWYFLSMITYGIGILPLICELRVTYPQVTQPWYADDAGTGGKFTTLQEHMWGMMVQGPPQGYFLEITKRILFVLPRNSQRAEEYFRGMGVGVVTGSRHLSSFIGEIVPDKSWLDKKLKLWTKSGGGGGWRGAPTSTDII